MNKTGELKFWELQPRYHIRRRFHRPHVVATVLSYGCSVQIFYDSFKSPSMEDGQAASSIDYRFE